MKKFKKVLLGALSALTFGLLFTVGTKVNAANSQQYVDLSLISGQTYTVGTTSHELSTTSETGNNTSLTSSFSKNETFANGYFNLTADGTSVCDGNGLKLQKTGCKFYFSTSDYTKITMVFYDSNASRPFSVTNKTKNLNVSISGKGYSASSTSVVTTIDDSDYTYSYSASSSGNLITLIINSAPADEYDINGANGTIYVQSIKIQPNITVKYETNGGSTIADESILAGNKYNPTITPTKEGSTFVGWYTNEELTDEFDSDIALVSDVTLYAKWADASAVYNVNFVKDGAAYGSSIAIAYDSNGDATIGAFMPTDPSKWGYSFDGWYTKDGTSDDWGTQITDSSNISSSMVTNKSITLYAKFTNSVTNSNILSLSYIESGATEKGTTSFSGSLPNTIYSVVNCKFESDSKTIGSLGNSKNDLRTGGRMVAENSTECSSNYFAINATRPGKLSIYARSTSSDARTFGVYKSTNLSTNLVSNTQVPNAVTNLEFDITESGDYYFGGVEGGIRVYYVSFTPDAEVSLGIQTGDSIGTTASGKAVRAVAAIVLNDFELSISKINVTVSGLNADDSVIKTADKVEDITYYTSISNLDGCGKTANTYYTYFSVYGLSSTYNNKKIKFVFEFVFTDGNTETTITEGITHTIAF